MALVLDFNMSKAIIKDTKMLKQGLRCRKTAKSDWMARWRCASKRSANESTFVSLYFPLLLPDVRTCQSESIRAPHRMNNWNNAERKRDAQYRWRSRNIDRKITIGLKSASSVSTRERNEGLRFWQCWILERQMHFDLRVRLSIFRYHASF